MAQPRRAERVTDGEGALGGDGQTVAVDGVVAGDGVAEDEEAVRPVFDPLVVATAVGRGPGGDDLPEWLEALDEFADDGIVEVEREVDEGTGIVAGFTAAGAGQCDDPAVPLDGQDDASPPGRLGRVGLHVHEGKSMFRAASGAR